MATSLVDADSLLAIDIGSTHTRAMFFDAVEDRYRLVAMGVAPTSAAAPQSEVQQGIRGALEQITEVTGRHLLNNDGQLLLPAEEGAGVDQVVITLSAGKPLQVVIAGVLPQVSLQSARRLAETVYGRIAAQLHLNDRLGTEGRINAVVRARPDVVIIAGGLEGGASQAVLQMVEAIGLAAYLIPQGQRPEVLFAGNSHLQGRVRELLEGITPLYTAANVQPALMQEQLGPAQEALLEIYRHVRERQTPGLQDWLAPLRGHSAFYPTAYAFGRMIRFLSRVYDPSKGVLGVDIGTEAVTVAAAWGGDGVLKTLAGLGLGSGLPELLRHVPAERISRWLPMEIPEEDLIDYLYNKSLHPGSIPITEEDLAIEHALARMVLRAAIQNAWKGFPLQRRREFGALLPYFEPILASGSVLTRGATPAQALLTLLAGIQPSGITTFVLDENHLLPALGAAADLNPVLSVQVLESHHFVPLATVITAAHRLTKTGAPILRVHIETSTGEKGKVELKTGQIRVVRLRPGQTATVEIRPLRGSDAGFGPGRRGSAVINGSTLGLVLDGRGRPVFLPRDAEKRRTLHRQWLEALGG